MGAIHMKTDAMKNLLITAAICISNLQGNKTHAMKDYHNHLMKKLKDSFHEVQANRQIWGSKTRWQIPEVQSF